MAKKNEAAAAAAPEQTALASSGDAALGFLSEFNFEFTGLEEVDREDLRFAAKVWNMKSRKPGGGPNDFFRVSEFFDTLTEQTQPTLRCVFVSLHKTRDYSYFDNGANETVRVCTSYDCVTGRLRIAHPRLDLAAGVKRQCETCPDKEWHKEVDKQGTERNVRDCAIVHGVIGVELDDQGELQSPFMIRFKKTSIEPWRKYMRQHHIKKWKDPRTRQLVDVPLFVYPVTISLEADKGGQFATPVFTRGEPLPRELIAELAEQAKNFREMAADVTRAAENMEQKHHVDDNAPAGGAGGNLNSSDFAD
jgi:hypothetical protein